MFTQSEFLARKTCDLLPRSRAELKTKTIRFLDAAKKKKKKSCTGVEAVMQHSLPASQIRALNLAKYH